MATATYRAMTATMAPDSGSTMAVKALKLVQPSMAAASVSSLGMPWKNVRTMITWLAVIALGSTTAQMVFSSPNLLMHR